MAENKMNIPSGFGGIMRYDSEYKSKFMVSPGTVIVFGVILILLVFALKIFFPLTI